MTPINTLPGLRLRKVVDLGAYRAVRKYRAILGAPDAVLAIAWSCPSCKAKAGDPCKRGTTHEKRADLAAKLRHRCRGHEGALDAILEMYGVGLHALGFIGVNKLYAKCERLPLDELLAAHRRREEAN